MFCRYFTVLIYIILKLFYIVIFIPVTSINADEGAGMSLGENVMVSLFPPTDLSAPIVLLRPPVLVTPCL